MAITWHENDRDDRGNGTRNRRLDPVAGGGGRRLPGQRAVRADYAVRDAPADARDGDPRDVRHRGPALAAGWAIHQFHGVALGLAYVALVQFEPLRGPARRLKGSLALGVAYGVLTTIALAVIVMPLWLSTVGFPGAPPFPNVAIPGTIIGLIGHIIYALPVALAYAIVTDDRE